MPIITLLKELSSLKADIITAILGVIKDCYFTPFAAEIISSAESLFL